MTRRRRQALRARRAHIILAQDFEHRGAGHAGDDGERNGAEHDRGQDEMAQRVEEGAVLIGEERVDRHEAGRLVEIIVDEVDAARDRQPAQACTDTNMMSRRPHQKIGIE